MPTYSRLTREQRYTIEVMNCNGSSQKEIAETIDKHPTTVCRELRRVGLRSVYCHRSAQREAEQLQRGGKRVDPAKLVLGSDYAARAYFIDEDSDFRNTLDFFLIGFNDIMKGGNNGFNNLVFAIDIGAENMRSSKT